MAHFKKKKRPNCILNLCSGLGNGKVRDPLFDYITL